MSNTENDIKDDSEFRDMVARRLKRCNATRRQLAEESGYTYQYINDIMSKKAIVSRAKNKILKALDVLEKSDIENRVEPDVKDYKLSVDDWQALQRAAEILGLSMDEFIARTVRNIR